MQKIMQKGQLRRSTFTESNENQKTQKQQLNKPSTTLRIAKESDLERLKLLYELWRDETNVGLDYGESFRNSHTVVAVDRYSNIVGFGSLSVVTINNRKFTSGKYVYVMPHYRDANTAYKIYRYLRKQSKRLGYSILMTSNPGDVCKWKKRGYEEWHTIMIRNP
jgi:GNAT superfamily N-acetyltransferase